MIAVGKKMRRQYLNARSFAKEAAEKVGDFDAIMGQVQKEYEALRKTGIKCPALKDKNNGQEVIIQVTKGAWKHVFKHKVKRSTKVSKIERAIAFSEAVKLLRKSTTYQEVSREKDRGNNSCLYFAIIGYVRGNRIKVVIRRQEKRTNPQFILHSWFQMSSSPSKQQDQTDK